MEGNASIGYVISFAETLVNGLGECHACEISVVVSVISVWVVNSVFINTLYKKVASSYPELHRGAIVLKTIRRSGVMSLNMLFYDELFCNTKVAYTQRSKIKNSELNVQ